MARYQLGFKQAPCVEQRKTVVKSSPSYSVLPNLLAKSVASKECNPSVAGLVPICGSVTPASQSCSPWLVHQLSPRVPPCMSQCSVAVGTSGSFTSLPRSPSQSTPRLPLSPQGGSFDVSDLHIGNQPFAPTNDTIKSQLISKLGVGSCLSIDLLHTGTGGLNEGMWIMRTSSQRDLILKLVSASRQEGKKVSSLARSHPSIVKDPMLAFPLHVFHCLGAGGTKRYDLIVMEKAKGRPLADFIGSKWYSQGADPVVRVMRKLGSCLREFHTRYRNSQHGDFQPSNIFYDEAGDKLVFIDVADIGTQESSHSDKEHFLEALRILSRAYGPNFLTEASGAFEAGYSR